MLVLLNMSTDDYGPKSEAIGFRCSKVMLDKIYVQMSILGLTRVSDYARIAVEEKIERDSYQFAEAPGNYESERPKRFDAELKRALISNKDIQKIIVDIVEKKEQR